MSHVQEQDKLLTSLLVEKQVPEFVRDEHPLFITFLEAYYEFLENEQGTQNNDLTTESKRLRLVQDIDSSLQSFEDNFLNTFANLVPKSTTASKEFLIKNVLPLYLAKGSERSFKLAFRLIFGVDAEIESPGDQVLRAIGQVCQGKGNTKRMIIERDNRKSPSVICWDYWTLHGVHANCSTAHSSRCVPS